MTDWGARAEALLIELSHLSEPGPGVTRLPFTPEHRAALDLLSSCMETAGLKVSLDDAGTLVGRLAGPPEGGTFLMGSHQDSGRESGAYDGIMGVVVPLIALEKLRADGVKLPFSVEILAFADEEGVRFPTALLGSRALAGSYDSSVLDMKDDSGVSLHDAMVSFGLNPGAIGELRRDPKETIGFLETHVEQGPVLERQGEAIGIVTAICGIERHQISVIGETGHAGTLPMEDRRDALVGAAAVVTEVNRIATSTSDLRATVGALSVAPNVVNAVPRAVQLTAEIRSPEDETRQAAGDRLHRFAQQLADDTGLQIDCKRTYSQAAQPCSRDLSKHLEDAMPQAGGPCIFLPSGATHDASAMADLCPVAMLFVRCRGGVSHRPEEFASSGDMNAAINVLAGFLISMRKNPA
ncbi:M20 family metallo-hydrolase [Pelagibius sp. Alg239-R121]|uniref:M20 family metallo-hydrolase n=1 Tax=Pelagibius sp. Alg239-R121 TaxID=2993448 RepID=UPI0024A6E7C6|nr:M20 family metallo-hydrolase [Pelagibius sp. Alg239-R121]